MGLDSTFSVGKRLKPLIYKPFILAKIRKGQKEKGGVEV